MTTEARTDLADAAARIVSRLHDVKRLNDFGGSLPMTVHDGIQLASLVAALVERVAALEAPQPTPEAELRRGIRGLFPEVQR